MAPPGGGDFASRATFLQLPARLISQRLESGVKVAESLCQLFAETARVDAQVSHRMASLVKAHANAALNEIEDSNARRLVEALIKYTESFARQHQTASLKLRECTQFSAECKQRFKGWKHKNLGHLQLLDSLPAESNVQHAYAGDWIHEPVGLYC